MGRVIDDLGRLGRASKPLGLRVYESDATPDASLHVNAMIAIVDEDGDGRQAWLAMSNGASWDRVQFTREGEYAFDWTWDTTTTDADPGSGDIRANHATLSSATYLYISETDRLGLSQASAIGEWDDSTNSVKGYLTLIDISDASVKCRFRITGSITDAGAYRKIPVAYVSGVTSLTNATNIAIEFERSGDVGQTGAPGDGVTLKSKSLSTPPVSPSTGDKYYVVPTSAGGGTASGAWNGHVAQIATWGGSSWTFADVEVNERYWIDDEGVNASFYQSITTPSEVSGPEIVWEVRGFSRGEGIGDYVLQVKRGGPGLLTNASVVINGEPGDPVPDLVADTPSMLSVLSDVDPDPAVVVACTGTFLRGFIGSTALGWHRNIDIEYSGTLSGSGINIHNHQRYVSDTQRETAFMRWNANEFEIGTESPGAGRTPRNMRIKLPQDASPNTIIYVESDFVDVDAKNIVIDYANRLVKLLLGLDGTAMQWRQNSAQTYGFDWRFDDSLGLLKLSPVNDSVLTDAMIVKRSNGYVGVNLSTAPTAHHHVDGVSRNKVYTVATLPAAGTVGAGSHAFVSDSNATLAAGIGNTVAGGGANFTPVYSDGTNWKIG